MSKIGGFSNGHPYNEFEDKMTSGLDRLFQNETDPVVKDMTRRQILRTRVWCRDYWLLAGKTVPHRIIFLEEN